MDTLYWFVLGALVGCDVVMVLVNRRLLRIVNKQDSDMSQILTTAQLVAEQNANLVAILQQGTQQPVQPMGGPVQ